MKQLTAALLSSRTFQKVNNAKNKLTKLKMGDQEEISNNFDINYRNALALNQQMQRNLLEVRAKIQRLVREVKDTYSINEEKLRKRTKRLTRKGFGMRGAYLKGGTFYLKGNMFFKDLNCRNCPNNPDYERRVKYENEMFPMDLNLCGRHVWSVKDKQGVVEGVKEQVIEHLESNGTVPNSNNTETQSQKLVKLLELLDENFRIDWNQISRHNLHNRHSANSCEAIWNVYLHPALNRSPWSEEENLKLMEVAKKYNYQNWAAIAKELGKRSDYQCFAQYRNYVCYRVTTDRCVKWTKEDDNRLVEVVKKNTINGVINWSSVMVHFPQRPKSTLQSRYTYSLNPKISHEPFTPKEDLLLLAAVKEYGEKFSCFPRSLFPNRTVVQLRTRYQNTLVHRHNQRPWLLEDDKKLMDFVMQHGTSSWKECERIMEIRSRISCRTRFYTIQSFFEKNPNATIEDVPRKQKLRRMKYSIVTTENWKEALEEIAKNPDVNLDTMKILNTRKQRRPSVKTKKVKEKKVRVKRKKSENEINIITEEETPTTGPKSKKTKLNNCNDKDEDDNMQQIDKTYNAKSRKNPLYVQRLRNIGLKMYHFFKYSYNYQLGSNPLNSNYISINSLQLPFVQSSLNFHHTSVSNNYKLGNNIPTGLKGYLEKLLHTQAQNINSSKPIVANTDYLLPPSWSTAMGFRALCIHTARNDINNDTAPNLEHIEQSNSYYIQLFRQRLRTLFYSNALLSRLHPNMVGVEDPTFDRHSPVADFVVSHSDTKRESPLEIDNETHEIICIHREFDEPTIKTEI